MTSVPSEWTRIIRTMGKDAKMGPLLDAKMGPLGQIRARGFGGEPTILNTAIF